MSKKKDNADEGRRNFLKKAVKCVAATAAFEAVAMFSSGCGFSLHNIEGHGQFRTGGGGGGGSSGGGGGGGGCVSSCISCVVAVDCNAGCTSNNCTTSCTTSCTGVKQD